MNPGRELFTIRANLAVVVRGSMEDLATFAGEVESLAEHMGLTVVHKQASASRLWVREGEGP